MRDVLLISAPFPKFYLFALLPPGILSPCTSQDVCRAVTCRNVSCLHQGSAQEPGVEGASPLPTFLQLSARTTALCKYNLRINWPGVSKNSREGWRASRGKQESNKSWGAFHTGNLEGLKSQIVRILSKCLLGPNTLSHTFPHFTSFLTLKKSTTYFFLAQSRILLEDQYIYFFNFPAIPAKISPPTKTPNPQT